MLLDPFPCSLAQVVQRFAYDAYGVALGFNETAALTNLLYSGEQADGLLGMQYLRARMYEPAAGRFGAVDSWSGHVRHPATLHDYLYAGANPVFGVDPTGLMTVKELFVASAVGGMVGILLGGLVAKGIFGYRMNDERFWYWVAGGAVVGATAATVGMWALLKLGVVTVAGAATAAGKGLAPHINWLSNNIQRIPHILQPRHNWQNLVPPPVVNNNAAMISHYQTQVAPIIQRVVETASTYQLQAHTNGAMVRIYEGTVNSYIVVVRIWESPTGQLVVENGFVR